MRDHGDLTAGTQLSPADNAVLYILRRIQLDANVRYYLGFGTEAFARLCRARAALTGQTEEEVRDEVLNVRPNNVSDLEHAQRRIEALEIGVERGEDDDG